MISNLVHRPRPVEAAATVRRPPRRPGGIRRRSRSSASCICACPVKPTRRRPPRPRRRAQICAAPGGRPAVRRRCWHPPDAGQGRDPSWRPGRCASWSAAGGRRLRGARRSCNVRGPIAEYQAAGVDLRRCSRCRSPATGVPAGDRGIREQLRGCRCPVSRRSRLVNPVLRRAGGWATSRPCVDDSPDAPTWHNDAPAPAVGR